MVAGGAGGVAGRPDEELEALPPFPTAVSASNLWPLLLWQLLKLMLLLYKPPWSSTL